MEIKGYITTTNLATGEEEILDVVATVTTEVSEETPTMETRVRDLESDNAETKEALELILSGVTE